MGEWYSTVSSRKLNIEREPSKDACTCGNFCNKSGFTHQWRNKELISDTGKRNFPYDGKVKLGSYLSSYTHTQINELQMD